MYYLSKRKSHDLIVGPGGRKVAGALLQEHQSAEGLKASFGT